MPSNKKKKKIKNNFISITLLISKVGTNKIYSDYVATAKFKISLSQTARYIKAKMLKKSSIQIKTFLFELNVQLLLSFLLLFKKINTQ